MFKDIIDQLIDMMLNYRQSGHPGGSRSKVHALVATLLGGVMRWDIRHPEKRFGDRFVLVAGTPRRSSTRRSPCSTSRCAILHVENRRPALRGAGGRRSAC